MIESQGEVLELYRITDTELTLERSEPLPGPPVPFTLAWVGPGEQCVFSDVRADDHSVGVYYLRTLGPRTLAYFGFKCPAPAP